MEVLDFEEMPTDYLGNIPRRSGGADIDWVEDPMDYFQGENTQEEEKTEQTTEGEENPLESVGSEEEVRIPGETSSESGEGGSSPNFYSSITRALLEDGVLSGLSDDDITKITDAEGFAEAIERQVSERLNARQKRISEALDNDVPKSDIQEYESVISFLGTLKDEDITNESEEGETLRRQLIYQDLVNRGYSESRAKREIEKSFKSGSDVEDAIEAKKALEEYYTSSYNGIIEQAKKAKEEATKAIQKEQEDLKNLMLGDNDFSKELGIDKKTRTLAYDLLTKPKYRDDNTGEILTEIQKAQRDNRTNFLMGMALAYTLTDGFKKLGGLTKGTVKKAVGSKLKELEAVLSTSSRPSGDITFVTKEGKETPVLDGRKIKLPF